MTAPSAPISATSSLCIRMTAFGIVKVNATSFFPAAIIVFSVQRFPSKSVSTVEVYADQKSVRQSEYYAADAQGKRLDMVLVINADDWNGATEVEYNNTVYNIERAYQVGLGRVELTCSRA